MKISQITVVDFDSKYCGALILDCNHAKPGLIGHTAIILCTRFAVTHASRSTEVP